MSIINVQIQQQSTGIVLVNFEALPNNTGANIAQSGCLFGPSNPPSTNVSPTFVPDPLGQGIQDGSANFDPGSFGGTLYYEVKVKWNDSTSDDTGVLQFSVIPSSLTGLFSYDPNTTPKITSITNIDQNTLQINWSAPTSGVVGYRIYRSYSYDQQFVPIGSTTSLFYVDGGLERDRYYFYRVASLY